MVDIPKHSIRPIGIVQHKIFIVCVTNQHETIGVERQNGNSKHFIFTISRVQFGTLEWPSRLFVIRHEYNVLWASKMA